VHAGEADGVHSIMEAISTLRAERIGHGFSLFSEASSNKEHLLSYIRNKNITIEVCLTSNLQTISDLKKVQDHNYTKMIENGLSVVICTDNRTVSKTSVSKELLLAREGINFTPSEFKELVLNGFQKSFFIGTQKQEYCRLCELCYDNLVKNTELDTK
jgi:adenosine deaminase